ncbi:MAG: 1,4-alpha-glucan branching protein GlgB [Simkaniaceae bacterium]
MDIKVEEAEEESIKDDFRLILQGSHPDPHKILGLHYDAEKKKTRIRLWRPFQEEAYIEVKGKQFKTKQIFPGIFEYTTSRELTWQDYRVHLPNGELQHDPYSFFPTFTPEDSYLFSRGIHYQIYNALGGRIVEHQGVAGAKFTVWAPEAMQVAVSGSFNNWSSDIFPMRQLYQSGVWEIFIPGIEGNVPYKFAVKTKHGHIRWKSDPYAVYSEKRPANNSLLFPVDNFSWEDDLWMEKRKIGNFQAQPMNIYELHLGSWKRGDKEFYNYRDLAPMIAAYCREMGYTHVEILPICEHPLDESWGYQVTGFYAPSSRYGSPEDFQFFINYMHTKEIGVILDWVPAHFPIDDYSLARFDGSYLYEHEDPRKGFHPHWNTLIFNYGRYEVSNFLIGSALFWIDKMHVDGLRVDAVASMLYLDYGRKDGEWIPNKYGGKENLEAIDFLKHLNYAVHHYFPGALTIAEESTAFPGITHALDWGGLGFDMKWNMGWMNDTLKYFEKDPVYRKFHHHHIHFMFSYAFSEKYILVLSHDEVVHGKRSLIAKMPGDTWQQFANARLLLGFMMCHPGKKLLFMGGELAQWNEWHCKEEVHWFLLEYKTHREMKHFVKQLNHFYLKNKPLWELDFEPKSLEWIDFSDNENSVISFFRRGRQSELVCVFNFTPVYRKNYFLRIPKVIELREVFNSDSQEFGGSGKLNGIVKLQKSPQDALGFYLDLSPLAFHIFEVDFE